MVRFLVRRDGTIIFCLLTVVSTYIGSANNPAGQKAVRVRITILDDMNTPSYMELPVSGTRITAVLRLCEITTSSRAPGNIIHTCLSYIRSLNQCPHTHHQPPPVVILYYIVFHAHTVITFIIVAYIPSPPRDWLGFRHSHEMNSGSNLLRNKKHLETKPMPRFPNSRFILISERLTLPQNFND